MEIKIRYTPENITVYPLDMEKLNIAINEFFHRDGINSPNIEYRTHGKQALIRQPSLCLIDDEFVGHDVGDKVIFYIYETEEIEEGKKVHTCVPTHEISITLPELEKYLTSPISLAEFTQDRRGYNSRIRTNEADWIRFFNK